MRCRRHSPESRVTDTRAVVETAPTTGHVARPNLVLTAACSCQLLVMLDASVVNVALPSIDRSLHFSGGQLPWVVDAYTLALGGLLLVGGRLADLTGHRRAMLCALVGFAMASVAGGLAQSPGQLIAARAAQGVAAALLAPLSLTVIMVTFADGAARHRAISVWAMVSAGGSALGVLLGGLLTDMLDWRWVLFINVPIIAAVLPLAAREVRNLHAPQRSRLDLTGALLATSATTLIVFGSIEAARYGWGSARSVTSFVTAAALAIGFAIRERAASAPIVRFSIFRVRTVWVANVLVMLIGAATIVGFYFASLFLQDVLGYPPLRAGSCFLPFCAGIVTGSTLSAKLAHRVSARFLLTAGLILGGVGMLLFSRLSVHSTFFNFLLPSVVASVGFGICMVSNTAMGASGAAPHEAGLVSGLLNASRQLGGSIGLAVLSTVAVSTTRGVANLGVHRALAAGYDRAFVVTGIVVLFAAAVAAVGVPRDLQPRRSDVANA